MLTTSRFSRGRAAWRPPLIPWAEAPARRWPRCFFNTLLGLGTRLVNECVRFARGVGCRKMTLWTNDMLAAARHIYEQTGFLLVHEESHHSFGRDLVGQTWELEF